MPPVLLSKRNYLRQQYLACWHVSTPQGGTKVAAPVLGALRNSFTVVQEATPRLNRWGISARRDGGGLSYVEPLAEWSISKSFREKVVGGETSLTSLSFFVPHFPAGLNRFGKKSKVATCPVVYTMYTAVHAGPNANNPAKHPTQTHNPKGKTNSANDPNQTTPNSTEVNPNHFMARNGWVSIGSVMVLTIPRFQEL